MSIKIIWAGETPYKYFSDADIKLKKMIGYDYHISNRTYTEGITKISNGVKNLLYRCDYLATDSKVSEEWSDLLDEPRMKGAKILLWTGKDWVIITEENILDFT